MCTCCSGTLNQSCRFYLGSFSQSCVLWSSGTLCQLCAFDSESLVISIINHKHSVFQTAAMLAQGFWSQIKISASHQHPLNLAIHHHSCASPVMYIIVFWTAYLFFSRALIQNVSHIPTGSSLTMQYFDSNALIITTGTREEQENTHGIQFQTHYLTHCSQSVMYVCVYMYIQAFM